MALRAPAGNAGGTGAGQTGGRMNAIGTWLRVDVRHRWRSLVILALLVAFAGGTIVAAWPGPGGVTRRCVAWTPLPFRRRPVLPNQPGFDWGRVERLPEVASVSTFAVDYTLSYQGLPSDVAGVRPPRPPPAWVLSCLRLPATESRTRLAGLDPISPHGTVFGVPDLFEDAAAALDRLGRGDVAGLADDQHPVQAE
jgi:hypothetical protein